MRKRTPFLIGLGVLALTAILLLVAWLVLDIDTTHFAALGLGIFFSLLVGVGLMTLVFYSSRSGHDERAHEAQLDLEGSGKPPARSEWRRED